MSHSSNLSTLLVSISNFWRLYHLTLIQNKIMMTLPMAGTVQAAGVTRKTQDGPGSQQAHYLGEMYA